MKGKIRNLGKNKTKKYFFINGEDGHRYYANINEVESGDSPKVSMFPYIWEGAVVESFDPVALPDGRYQATNIVLSGRVSADERYWDGRTDALTEFAYWYFDKGERLSFNEVSKYLNQMIGWIGSKEQKQAVRLGAWTETKAKSPRDKVPVILQTYDVNEHDIAMFTAYRKNGTWYQFIADGEADPEVEIATDLYVPEAWMSYPEKWTKHNK